MAQTGIELLYRRPAVASLTFESVTSPSPTDELANRSHADQGLSIQLQTMTK